MITRRDRIDLQQMGILVIFGAVAGLIASLIYPGPWMALRSSPTLVGAFFGAITGLQVRVFSASWINGVYRLPRCPTCNRYLP